jgi:valyl-tRNA synthetase
MIEQFTKVLAKVIFNKDAGNIEEAQRTVEKAFNSILGVDSPLLLSLPESSMVELFGLLKDKEIGSAKCLIAAKLLKEYSDIRSKIENKTQINEYTKALNYYLDGLINIGDNTINTNEYFKEMNEIIIKPEIIITNEMKSKINKVKEMLKAIKSG